MEEHKTIPNPSIQPMNITQALVGLGFDETDPTVLRYFNFFTKQIPADAAYFIHVLPKFDLMNAMYEKDIPKIGQYTINEDLIQQMEIKVDTTFPQKNKLYVEYDVKEGDPLDEMLRTSEDLKIDLLVIGQSKKAGSHKILAKNLARKTNANALIIPQDANTDIANILVPIDFSPNSIRTLKAAVSFHKQLKAPAKLTCIYVYRMPNQSHFKFEESWGQTQKAVESNIMDAFNAFIFTNAPEYQDQIEIALVEKTEPGIAQFIMNYAVENNCDFMFLGAKGHSKVHRLLMGSVTEEILDINNQIPTMVIK